MIIGFKTGPETWSEGQQIVKKHGATFCEIWFNILRADEYVEPLAWLKNHGVNIGLHYWGMIDTLKPNYATTNTEVRTRTLKQMKDCIDLGASYEASYVNVHPSARMLETLDVDSGKQGPLLDTKAQESTYKELLLAGSAELQAHAASRGVTLTIETLPGRENYDRNDRTANYNPGNPTLTDCQEITQAGCYLANDVTHTASAVAPSCPVDSQRACMTETLLSFTTTTAAATKLIHANTCLLYTSDAADERSSMVEPFDGTDTHDGVRDIDFENDVFPGAALLKQILSMFRQREDVFVIPEPKADMEQNYFALTNILQSL